MKGTIYIGGVYDTVPIGESMVFNFFTWCVIEELDMNFSGMQDIIQLIDNVDSSPKKFVAVVNKENTASEVYLGEYKRALQFGRLQTKDLLKIIPLVPAEVVLYYIEKDLMEMGQSPELPHILAEQSIRAIMNYQVNQYLGLPTLCVIDW